MIFRHWQRQANGDSAANATRTQRARRCGIQVTLLGSKLVSVIPFISISHPRPHPVFGTLPHFSLIFTFARSLPRPGLWHEEGGACHFLPVRAGGGRCGGAAGKAAETKAAVPEVPESKQRG